MKYAAYLIIILFLFIIGSGCEKTSSNEKLHSKIIDIQLKGIPVNVYGMEVAGQDKQQESLLEWVVVLNDGQLQRFRVDLNNGQVDEMTGYVTPISSAIPHFIKPAKIEIKPGEFPPDEASRWITPLVVRKDVLVFVEGNGDVVFWNKGEIDRLSVNALPDTRILMDNKERLLLLSNPTERYQHGIMGNTTEAGGFVIIDTNNRKVIRSVTIHPPDVIESLQPIWADWDQNGEREIVLTLSNNQTGARLSLFNEAGDLLAEGKPVGKGHRWRHAMTIAPFGLDGNMELAEVMTPHIGGILQYVRWDKENNSLTSVASEQGYSTHDIGAGNMDMFTVIDWDQDGISELLLPNQRKNELMVLKRTTEGIQNVITFPLNGRLNTNLVALKVQKQTEFQSIIAAGTKEGRLMVWIN